MKLNYPRKSHANGGFTGASTTDNSNFVAWFDCKVKLFEHHFCVRAVFEFCIDEFNLPLLRPRGISFCQIFTLVGFLGNCLKVEDTLHLDHHALEVIERS